MNQHTVSSRSTHRSDADETAHTKRAEQRTYLWGFGLALILTLIPFGLVAFGSLSAGTIYIVIGACAILQVVVHFRFFLHITLARNKREDLQLILFTVLILTIMVGGTLWILFNLYYRMMPDMLP
ncbi:cytochrome o ubiquinol oxidase subunit IV [Salinicola rhizosphaerae]|uniref:Cytochrome bo(3) ubiquinol oxidase subunit 4 n=1 Tax=Salinicola rhizosphaerae TaxID=1443141 RepID=A0ABQ3DZC1_9GAMM|nr:cytochrome o ubiquinol oxidase subunit IV [Salinicola rhizosphaerae]GHB21177.1 cytochrome o ubiquinol oxidase subunit IV [Salinicola rhizosphaerae]